MTKKTWKIPFDKDGNHVNWISRWQNKEDFTFKDHDFEFNGFLYYKGISWNNSTFNTLWETPDGKQFIGGQQILDDILERNYGTAQIPVGAPLSVTGQFYFKKQGSSVLLHIKK